MPTLIIGNSKIKVSQKQAEQILTALRKGKDIKVKNQKGQWITSKNKSIQLIKGD